jgi:hypothetical protein
VADAFGRPEPVPRGVPVTGGNGDPCGSDRYRRMAADPLIADQLQPSIDGGDPARVQVGDPVGGDDLACAIEISCRHDVFDGIVDESMVHEPFAGSPVEGRYLLALRPAQLVVQGLSKQVVISVPAPVAVKRHKEQIRAVQPLDDRFGLGHLDDGLAERGREAVEDRCTQEESTNVRG